VEFYLVYIQEAHASDAWQLDINEKENVIYKKAQHYDERVNLAGTCSMNLGIGFPALVDTIENTTEIAYTAWPDRLYLIDGSGRIAYKSEAGPFGFKTDELSESIEQLLEQENNSPGK
jgi:type I thyroxine 5'-deiodinase